MIEDPEIEEKRLCVECVDEPFLANLMAKHGEKAACDYCDRTGMTETIVQLADRFEAMFDQHFEREGEIDYRWDEPHGETVEFVIADSGSLPDAAASDIQSVMEDRHSDLEAAQMGDQTAYDSELTYVESHVDDRELQEDWSHLELELKTKRRFFSREAEAGFDRLRGDGDWRVLRNGQNSGHFDFSVDAIESALVKATTLIDKGARVEVFVQDAAGQLRQVDPVGGEVLH